MKTCPSCGSATVSEVRDDDVTCGSQKTTVRVRGDWCGTCGEVVFSGDALKTREDAYLKMKNKNYIMTTTAVTSRVRTVTAVGRYSGADQTVQDVLKTSSEHFFRENAEETLPSGERYVTVSCIVTDWDTMREVGTLEFYREHPRGPWKRIDDLERHNAAMNAQWNLMSSGDVDEEKIVKKSTGFWIVFGVVGIAMILFAYMLDQGLKGVLP